MRTALSFGSDLRWLTGWRLLAIATILYVAIAMAPSTSNLWILITAFAGWYALSVPLGSARLYGSLLVSLVYFAPGWVIWSLLLDRHPATYALAAVFFPFTFSMLPTRRAILFSLVLGAVMFVAGSHWAPKITVGVLAGGAIMVAASVMLALFIDAIVRQSEERQRLIEELQAAREDQVRAEREAGKLAERQRMAQQIHDTVAQGFVGVVTHLEAAEQALGERERAVAEHLEAAKVSARSGLEEARRLVWDLRPDLRAGEPLPAVLERQVQAWAAKSGVPANLVVSETLLPLDPDLDTALLHAAREALNNVRTHARARRVTVTLRYMRYEVTLDIQDDGIGFSPAPDPPRRPVDGGYGLRALEARVRGLGGRLSIESQPGEGTTLTVSLPLGGPA
jgi:signal transduction histidine kinase